jgi:hypothetical protein
LDFKNFQEESGVDGDHLLTPVADQSSGHGIVCEINSEKGGYAGQHAERKKPNRDL